MYVRVFVCIKFYCGQFRGQRCHVSYSEVDTKLYQSKNCSEKIHYMIVVTPLELISYLYCHNFHGKILNNQNTLVKVKSYKSYNTLK